MSDTMPVSTSPKAADNFSANRETKRNENGEQYTETTIRFGDPSRSMVVKSLTLLDQFDLLEIAGERASNSVWMLQAEMAFGLKEIDGVPALRPAMNAHLRANIVKIRTDGWEAYARALIELREKDQAEHGGVKEAAKN